MPKYLIPFVTFGIVLQLLLGFVGPAHAAPNTVLAINIALEPDATMTQHAEAANAQLLKSYPQGFALDATHKPHITILQRYVRADNLNNIYAMVDAILAGEKVASWKLKATHYYLTPWDNMFLGVIAVEPNDKLIKLQQKLIEAINPFTEKTGAATAFVTTPEEPVIDKTTINYVTAFVPERIGKNFNPHVTLGLARQGNIKEIIREPLNPFTFSPVGMTVYQISTFGTARKKLKEWHERP